MGPQSAKIQAAFLFLPVFLGCSIAIILPAVHSSHFLFVFIAILGTSLIIGAKISQKKRTRQLYEFGFRNMTLNEKRLYILGYFLLGLSVILTLLFESLRFFP
jgi:hypothetical protein